MYFSFSDFNQCAVTVCTRFIDGIGINVLLKQSMDDTQIVVIESFYEKRIISRSHFRNIKCLILNKRSGYLVFFGDNRCHAG